MDLTLHLQKLLNIPDEDYFQDGYAVFSPPFQLFTEEERASLALSGKIKNVEGYFPRPKLTLNAKDWEEMGRPSSIVISVTGAREGSALHHSA